MINPPFMLGRVGMLLIVGLGLLGLATVGPDAGLAVSPGHSVDSPDFGSESAEFADCGTCHDDESKVSFPNSEVCLTCHEDTASTYRNSTHSVLTDTNANFNCLECHSKPEDGWYMHFRAGPHGAENPDVSYAPEDTCSQTACHDRHNPMGAIYAEWNEVEDRDWNSSKLSHSKSTPEAARDPRCSGCHGSHTGSLANIEDAPEIHEYAADTQPDAESIDEWRITCPTCHDPHDVRHDDSLRGDFESSSTLCAQCHAGSAVDEVSRDQAHVHRSTWTLYENSKFAPTTAGHQTLECTSCHMASQNDTEAYNAVTGHSFDVDTELLGDTDRLDRPGEYDCGICHAVLTQRIAGRKAELQTAYRNASRMRAEANETLVEQGLAEDPELTRRLSEGTYILESRGHPDVAIHNPEMAGESVDRAIEIFQQVKTAAEEQGADGDTADGQDGEQTTTAAGTDSDGTATETTSPGPNPIMVIGAVVAGVLAVRRFR